MVKDFCFGTLAVGKRYRTHAIMLAKDIQEQAPNVSFVVLTDQPADFAEYKNVIPIKHRLQSVKGYHDKRFVIEKSFERFDTCIFLDSDVRIIGSVPEDMKWLPGITARTGCNIIKHNTGTKLRVELAAIEQVAQRLDINLQEAKWFHEFMFVVTKQAGAEKVFLKLWQNISKYFEMQGIYGGEGNVMGLAAAKAGLNIRFDSEDIFPFFKDNIEQIRVKMGQSNLADKQIYFQMHKEIEYPKLAIWRKIIDKITRQVVFFYRLLKLRYFKHNTDLIEFH
ncbi:MAG: hypothetical protein HC874_02680 [Richelia sp. SL_2_1]|nr:hypothetical protein [Richelia sp. RM1_1_1]NJO26549.1 hypothetical protein [Richelia sp. SL_2_1]